MIREQDKRAWRNFWLKVVPFLVAVLFLASHAGVANEQTRHSLTGYRADCDDGSLVSGGYQHYAFCGGVQWLTQFLTTDAP